MPADRDPEHLHPDFRVKVQKILTELQKYADEHMPGHTWILVEGYRTPQYQNELYQKGRTIKPIGARYIVTYRDGFNHRSNHQSSLAADLVPKKGHVVVWDAPQEHWAYLGHLARLEGLRWGGDWKKLKDLPHIEWPEDDTAMYDTARAWQEQQHLG